jgi:hypothetical protein
MELAKGEEVLREGIQDGRLRKRCEKLLEEFVKNPEESIPKALKEWGMIKSAYRFFQNENITKENLIEEARKETVKRVEGSEGYIMIAHDTTHVDYSNLEVEGLGRNTSQKYVKGFLLHSGLAMTDKGVALGIVSQDIWTRGEKRRGREKKDIEIEEKESNKWVKSFEESIEAIGKGVRSISV